VSVDRSELSPRGQRHCSGAFLDHIRRAALPGVMLCSCCCACNRLFLNGRWIQRRTDKPNTK
jgi:hypothetical protein